MTGLTVYVRGFGSSGALPTVMRVCLPSVPTKAA